MSSQFFGLNIAYSGLLASNSALNTTANNISNVQTEGYSKQEVVTQAAQAIRTFASYGCAGAGVDTLSVERIRDEFYDSKYWNNSASVGEYDMKAYYMEEMEGYFYDSGDNAGFTSVFNQFAVTGLEELLKNPSDNSLKSQFVGYAGQLTDYFNGLYGNLQEMQKDVNSELKLQVDTINSLASEIASLNKQINTIELTGTNANELRDKRTSLLDELSQIVDVDTIETPVTDTNDPTRETGANRFVVKIAGGQTLVDDAAYSSLEVVARSTQEKVNQTDIDGLYDVYWVPSSLYSVYTAEVTNDATIPNDEKQTWNDYVKEHGQKFNLYNAAMGGKLRGLVEMRDGNNGEYFTGTVTEIANTSVNSADRYMDADGKMHDTVTVRVDDDYLKDLNKCNLSDQGGIINLGNKEYTYDSWSMTYDAEKDEYSYTFVLTNSGQSLTNDRVGKTAGIGADVDYQGIPYYMRQMNEWCRSYSAAFNNILSQGDDGNTNTTMFTGDKASYNASAGENSQMLFSSIYGSYATDSDGNPVSSSSVNTDALGNYTGYTIKDTDDSYYKLTAGNITILNAMENDPSLMANKYHTVDGVENNDLLLDLQSISTDSSALSFRGSSASEFLQQVLSDVALNASSANTFQSSYTNINETIDTKRMSISGVDEDEEAVNLVKYQNAYNLASKMISVFQEIYDRLINNTGV